MSNGTDEMITAAARAANTGTSTSNLYIDVAMQGAGTLTGNNVDANLMSAKAERLLAFRESMRREVNTAAESYSFSAGEIKARWAYGEVLQTKIASYLRDSFLQGNFIGPIKVWRTEVINKKLTIINEFSYENCLVTEIETNAIALAEQKLDTLKFWFRFTKCQTTLKPHDQTGQAQGNYATLVDFAKGTLQAPS